MTDETTAPGNTETPLGLNTSEIALAALKRPKPPKPPATGKPTIPKTIYSNAAS
jgi:hypothetical protein